MSRRVRNRPTPIPTGYPTLVPDFVTAVHRWAASVDSTGKFAHVDLEAHLRAFPDCRAFNCGTYAAHQFGRKVLWLCMLLGVLAFALIGNWVMGTAAFVAFTGVGVWVHKHKLKEVNRIHEEQRADPHVQTEELTHTRQFVKAMFEQFTAHLEECKWQHEHLAQILRHGGEPEHSAGVKTVRALHGAVLRRLQRAEAQTEHMINQGELYQAYMGTVRWYTEWHRLFVAAAREADKGQIRHDNVQRPLGELGKLMEKEDQEQQRPDRLPDRRGGLRAMIRGAGG